MKRCPACNRTYDDESLVYCMADGSPLSDASAAQATQPVQPPRITNAQPEALPANSQRVEAGRADRSPVPMYLIIALLALLVGGGAVALLRPGAKESSMAGAPASNSSSLSNSSNLSETSSTSTTSRRPETEARPSPTANRDTTAVRGQSLHPSGGTWFVILGSFPRNNYEKADQRLKDVRGMGYEASIINTDDYPGLRGSLWAVVMGPYSKSDAKSIAAQMKSVRSDAYIKSGW